MVELKVPNIIDPREEKIKLYCNYELDAGEKLYSIKWYKDTNEFYRFMPDANPSGVDFHVDNLQVSIIDSNDKVITLIQNLDVLNYGKYNKLIIFYLNKFPYDTRVVL